MPHLHARKVMFAVMPAIIRVVQHALHARPTRQPIEPDAEPKHLVLQTVAIKTIAAAPAGTVTRPVRSPAVAGIIHAYQMVQDVTRQEHRVARRLAIAGFISVVAVATVRPAIA